MMGAVLKTVVAEHLGQAGSIPVRLRHCPLAIPEAMGHLDAGAVRRRGVRPCDDPRRSVPRTDVVLADPRIASHVDRLGAPGSRPWSPQPSLAAAQVS